MSRDCSNVDAIVWPETEIGEVASVRCPCGPEGENPLPPQSVATRRCGGNYDDGAEWGPQMCTECQFSDDRFQLCELLEVCPYCCASKLLRSTYEQMFRNMCIQQQTYRLLCCRLGSRSHVYIIR